MRHLMLLGILTVALAGLAQVPTSDVLGSHDLGPSGPGPVTGGLPSCQFCHAPHSSLSGLPVKPLWTQQLSTANYTLYASTTVVNKEQQPALGSPSNLCLSCHDGTIAPGQTTPYGRVTIKGSMSPEDVFGTTLQGTHPFNFQLPLQAAPNLLGSVVSSGRTANPAVKLFKGNVECTSCHNPHVEAIDPIAKNFLVTDNSGSKLCLACHVSAPSPITAHTAPPSTTLPPVTSSAVAAASVQTDASPLEVPGGNSQRASTTYNPFTAWTTSIHAVASHKVAKGKQAGSYGSPMQNGCLSCHAPHNAAGGKQLLNGPIPAVPNMDASTQTCITCHGVSSTVTPAVRNVFSELGKTGHPLPTANASHGIRENAVLQNNRHATCVDCHNPHASGETASFSLTTIRGAQTGATGISATDGMTVVSPAVNQFETCLRCHGSSAGKQILSIFGYLPTRAVSDGDPLNLVPQFGANSRSSHPVVSARSGSLPQPSLLNFMLNLDGRTRGRPMGTRLLCTDCHNSDDNREFGGPGPNGPHGSQFPHILERRYEFSQVRPGIAPAGGPGTAITNLLPVVVDPGAAGPYALCAKCHDLNNVMSNASFRRHASHLNAGFSCSVCHTAHGTGAAGSTISGERLVNFDVQVVAPNDAINAPISYNRAADTCVLKCHNVNHNADGTVVAAGLPGAQARRQR